VRFGRPFVKQVTALINTYSEEQLAFLTEHRCAMSAIYLTGLDALRDGT
jgi:hypothetical protein